MLCHGIKELKELKPNGDVRRFRCICGRRWSWTVERGYYNQGGRPPSSDPKVVRTYRVHKSEDAAIRAGEAQVRIEVIKKG